MTSLKNYLLKKKQLKGLMKSNAMSEYLDLPFHCPKCYFRTDTLELYSEHLESHIIKNPKKVI